MANVKLETPIGKAKSSEKRADAALQILNTLPPNASANAKIDALTTLVMALSEQLTYLMSLQK